MQSDVEVIVPATKLSQTQLPYPTAMFGVILFAISTRSASFMNDSGDVSYPEKTRLFRLIARHGDRDP